jgi:hypothetical protein
VKAVAMLKGKNVPRDNVGDVHDHAVVGRIMSQLQS